MPCVEIREKGNRRGFICFRNEPVRLTHPSKYNRRVYYFEWTPASGWMPVNRDGSERLSPVPNGVWRALERRYPKWTDEKERARAKEQAGRLRKRKEAAAKPTEE